MLHMASTIGNRSLFIEYDTDPQDPREWNDLGKMICWHRRYRLGDKHTYADPEELLSELVRNNVPKKRIVKFIKSGGDPEQRFAYNRSSRLWELHSKAFWCDPDPWCIEEDFKSMKAIPENVIDAILENMRVPQLMTLLNDAADLVLMPLYLYDHGGITISTSAFSCLWDSGQIGWIFADREMIVKEHGVCNKRTLARTREILEGEVQTYDLYLTGQCYGYRLYEGEEETDSCWGFLGDSDSLIKDLPGEIGKENQDLIDALSHCHYSSIDEYFWRNRISA